MSTIAPPLTDHLGQARATDYFFLREQLSEQQLAALRRVRAFVDDEVCSIGDYWANGPRCRWPLDPANR